jgi:hypothetical protein
VTHRFLTLLASARASLPCRLGARNHVLVVAVLFQITIQTGTPNPQNLSRAFRREWIKFGFRGVLRLARQAAGMDKQFTVDLVFVVGIAGLVLYALLPCDKRIQPGCSRRRPLRLPRDPPGFW